MAQTNNMSVLKQIVDRGATVAWSPTHPALIAVATKEGVGSRGFDDYGSLLELYQLNMQTDPDDVKPLGTIETRQSQSLQAQHIPRKLADSPLNVYSCLFLLCLFYPYESSARAS